MRTIIYCPKCKSENVVEVQLTPEHVNRVSIDDLGRALSCEPMIFWTHRYLVVCRGCGYRREYQYPPDLTTGGGSVHLSMEDAGDIYKVGDDKIEED